MWFSSGEEELLGLLCAEVESGFFTRNGWKRRRLLGFMLKRGMRLMRRSDIEGGIAAGFGDYSKSDEGCH